jgi:hypothetical protein
MALSLEEWIEFTDKLVGTPFPLIARFGREKAHDILIECTGKAIDELGAGKSNREYAIGFWQFCALTNICDEWRRPARAYLGASMRPLKCFGRC